MLLLTCSIILVGCAYTARGGFGEWLRIRRLRSIGRTTIAEVTDISRRLPRKERGAPSEYVTFEFRPAPNAEPIVGERLRSLFKDRVQPAGKLDVRYDPDNPSDFFCLQSDDYSLVWRLSVQIIFLGVVGVLLLMVVFRYRALIRTVCNAPVVLGRLVDVRSCAQGAFSRLVVVTFEFDSRTIVLKTVVPVHLAHSFSIGDSVYLLVPPRKPKRALLAGAFL